MRRFVHWLRFPEQRSKHSYWITTASGCISSRNPTSAKWYPPTWTADSTSFSKPSIDFPWVFYSALFAQSSEAWLILVSSDSTLRWYTIVASYRRSNCSNTEPRDRSLFPTVCFDQTGENESGIRMDYWTAWKAGCCFDRGGGDSSSGW